MKTELTLLILFFGKRMCMFSFFHMFLRKDIYRFDTSNNIYPRSPFGAAGFSIQNHCTYIFRIIRIILTICSKSGIIVSPKDRISDRMNKDLFRSLFWRIKMLTFGMSAIYQEGIFNESETEILDRHGCGFNNDKDCCSEAVR